MGKGQAQLHELRASGWVMWHAGAVPGRFLIKVYLGGGVWKGVLVRMHRRLLA
jgi:hypothetical protein